MKSSAHKFKDNAGRALKDGQLKRALDNLDKGLVANRAKARANLPEFDKLRDLGRDIKNHTLEHLDLYLEAFEAKVTQLGGTVHWAEDAREACDIVTGLCKAENAGLVTKSKSMITEEIGLNEALDKAGITPVETDLAEYIIQLREEPPSHIIVPAIHLNRDQIADTFLDAHQDLPKSREFPENADLVAEARQQLRQKFLTADIGITGANFLVAETGSAVIVTNEGNADLTQTLPKTHIVVASIEKMVPTLEDAATLIRLLARSATGQDITAYTTFATGPARKGDPDGPQDFHVVLLDNGRSGMLGSEFHDMLRCIRCGACMNHCPVYGAVGGHAYGWVYPGPMGAVLTPSLIGLNEARLLPNASTFCGRCEAVCPMHIPLPAMMRKWRMREFENRLTPPVQRYGLAAWKLVAKRPWAYQALTRLAIKTISLLAGRRGALKSLPLAGGWTAHRDLPAPQGDTFQAQWRRRHRS
jgi:L-lactate dehydrogenase complex protein LldF